MRSGHSAAGGGHKEQQQQQNNNNINNNSRGNGEDLPRPGDRHIARAALDGKKEGHVTSREAVGRGREDNGCHASGVSVGRQSALAETEGRGRSSKYMDQQQLQHQQQHQRSTSVKRNNSFISNIHHARGDAVDHAVGIRRPERSQHIPVRFLSPPNAPAIQQQQRKNTSTAAVTPTTPTAPLPQQPTS